MFFLLIAQTIYSQDILGKWLTDDGEAIIEIYKHQGKFNGRIVWLKNEKDTNGKPWLDSENPKKELRHRPIIGLDILSGLTYENGKWTGGTIYDPDNGKTYKCSMWIESGKLKVRGHLGVFYDTQTWTRSNK
jgi:uncharacterized protein (DUF2147 family)